MPEEEAVLADELPEIEQPEPAPEAPEPSAKRSKQNPEGIKPLPKVPGKPARGGGRTCAPTTLFEYWLQRKTASDKERLVCYVYRDHPKLDVLQTLTPEQLGEVKAHKRKGPPTNICKWLECPVTDPADWKQEVLHQFGAGTYHFILNDTRFNEAAGTRASGGAAIARADTGDLGDCETYPPVLNYDHLDMGHDSNASYIRWCRSKGIRLPGDPATPFDAQQQETDDMAAQAESVKTLADALVTVSSRREPPPPAPREDSGAAERVAAVVGNMAEKSFDMLAKGLDRMAENKANSEDPFAVADRLIQMNERLAKAQPSSGAPASNDNPILNAILAQNQALRDESTALRGEFTKLLLSQIAGLEARIAAMAATPPPPAVAPQSADGELTKLLLGVAKEKLVDLFSGGGADETPPESRLETILKVAAPAITNGLSNLASIAYNVAQARTGGRPLPPTDSGEQQQPGQPAVTAAPPVMENIRQFLPLVTEPIKAAVLGHQDGAVFAAQLLLSTGAQGVNMYNEILAMGADRFSGYVAMHPPLGEFAAGNPEAFGAFVGQFMDADRVRQLRDQMVMAQSQQPETAAAPRTVKRPVPAGSQPQ